MSPSTNENWLGGSFLETDPFFDARAAPPLIAVGCQPTPISALLMRAAELSAAHRWEYRQAGSATYRDGDVAVMVSPTNVVVTREGEHSLGMSMRRSRADGGHGRNLSTLLASWAASAAVGIDKNEPTALEMASKTRNASAMLAVVLAATGAEFSRILVLGTGDVHDRRVYIDRQDGRRYRAVPASIEGWVDTQAPRYRSLRPAVGGMTFDSCEGECTARAQLEPVSMMRLLAALPQHVIDAVAKMERRSTNHQWEG